MTRVLMLALLVGCGGGPTVMSDLPWLVASEQSEGSVAVVAVLDFECEHSRRQFAILTEQTSDRLHIVRRYMPRNEASMPATRGVLCAEEQGRESVFAPMLFARRAAQSTPLSAADVLSIAEETDMDARSLEHCMSTEASTELVRREIGDLQQIGIEALPTLFVGRERHNGFVNSDELQASAERERARSGP